MARAIYSAPVGAAVGLVAATPKTILGVITPAQFGGDFDSLQIGFDGVTASDKAVAIEIVAFTADGTGTAGTVAQIAGRSITTGFTTKYNYSVEPTGATVLARFTVTPIGGTAVLPFNGAVDIGVSAVLGVRCTAPTSAVNANATLIFARC